jgi:1-acyl-sn-glycerol-3-phosphate acyltransferase
MRSLENLDGARDVGALDLVVGNPMLRRERDQSAHERRSFRPRHGGDFRFDEKVARRLVRLIDPIMRLYFRADVRGVENFPDEQTFLVANHDGGMLPLDSLAIGSAWHRRFDFTRPLGVLVHDMVMRLAPSFNRIGAVLADRPHLEAVLDAGHSVLIYPGGSRETFRSFFERKQVTLGNRTGFIKHALKRRIPITPVVSAGVHETFFVLWRGGWLADRLGITRRFRADVFPIVAGLPFGIWLGALMPQIPLPAKITVEILPAVNVIEMAENFLGRALRDEDIEDATLIYSCFERIRTMMQDAHSRLYAARRLPILG